MGNNITNESEDFDDYVSDDSSLGGFDGSEQIHIAYSMLAHIVQQETNEMPPVIRKKPDLRIFRVSCPFYLGLAGQNRIKILCFFFSLSIAHHDVQRD